MAARGHAGLPMQIGGGSPPQAGPGGALPAQMPGNAPSGPSSSDRQVAESAAQTLLAATAHANDPALKAAFSTALAALHKYIVQDDKEHHQAVAGKLSPRLMAQAHGRAV
jgi:hypothetical protein